MATGGLPAVPMPLAETLIVSTWDILAGDVPLGRRTLVFEDRGVRPATSLT